jgi:hypothetical protein
MTSIPYDPSSWQTDGRMYPPQDDAVHPVSAHVDRIARLLSTHRAELGGAFVVVDAHKVRIRRRTGEP